MNNKNEILSIGSISIFDYMEGSFRKIQDRLQLRSLLGKKHFPKNGDGHSVIIIPDYFMKSRSVSYLKKGLQSNGYRPYIIKLDKSIFQGKNFKRISSKVKDIYRKSNQPVSLIGTGIGGGYARLLAQKFEDKIRQVILFQAPFNTFNDHKNIKLLFSFAYRGGKIGEFTSKDVAQIVQPTIIPTTLFYCKKDDMIAWETCIEKEDGLHQNIEFKGEDWNKSFIEAYPIILNRLKYNKNNWKKYEGEVF